MQQQKCVEIEVTSFSGRQNLQLVEMVSLFVPKQWGLQPAGLMSDIKRPRVLSYHWAYLYYTSFGVSFGWNEITLWSILNLPVPLHWWGTDWGHVFSTIIYLTNLSSLVIFLYTLQSKASEIIAMTKQLIFCRSRGVRHFIIIWPDSCALSFHMSIMI